MHPASRRPAVRLLLIATLVGLPVLVGVVGVYVAHRRDGNRVPAETPSTKHGPPPVGFRDITSEVGIAFIHHNGARGEKRLPESMGSGCAFLDYDNDGRQDLLLINGRDWSDTPDASRRPATLALYRNQGTTFQDVTRAAGLDVAMYGMGVACGDFDNDGWTDIFVSAVGENRLFQNQGGTFLDVTASAGVAGDDADWSTSCGWLDYDNDSDLDLFVCNYLQWSVEREQARRCRLPDGHPVYCPPTAFDGAMPYLYRNEGDGTFREVSEEAGVRVLADDGQPLAKALGLAPADLDGDGWIDLILANDTVRNLVFRNQGNGRFREIGQVSGLAYDSSGNARGAMGIDVGDFRNDGSLAVGIGNFAGEMAALYIAGEHPWQFTDQSLATGVGPPTRDQLTFGLLWLDYDLDSRLDLLLANGHLEQDIGRVDPAQRYSQSAQLFHNAGRHHAPELVSVGDREAGRDLFRPLVGRGASYADIDADGDLDLVLTSCGGPSRLLRCEPASPPPHLRLRLIGRDCNRDAIGSWLEVVVDGQTLRRQVMPTRGYLSQVELPISVGLGDSTGIERIEVLWADGTRQSVTNAALNSLTTVVQQTGLPTAELPTDR
jgi:hypothetical protein